MHEVLKIFFFLHKFSNLLKKLKNILKILFLIKFKLNFLFIKTQALLLIYYIAVVYGPCRLIA